jgi:hypothetical protein
MLHALPTSSSLTSDIEHSSKIEIGWGWTSAVQELVVKVFIAILANRAFGALFAF